MLTMFARRAFALAVALTLVGCAVRPGEPPTIDRIKPILKLAVMIGTDRLLTQNPKAVPIVLQVLQTLQSVVNNTEITTPAALQQLIQAKLDTMQLAPDVRMVINMLMDSVAGELRVQIQRLDIPDTAAVMLIREVLGWIGEVAQRHMQAPVRPVKISMGD